MGLFSAVGQKVALSWLGHKVSGLRKRGSPVVKALDGKKGYIVALGVVVAGVVHATTGYEVGPLMEAAFRAAGWGEELSSDTARLATGVVPVILAAWASWDGFRKLRKQRQAGATFTEALSTVGAVKVAIVERIIPVVQILEPKKAKEAERNA